MLLSLQTSYLTDELPPPKGEVNFYPALCKNSPYYHVTNNNNNLLTAIGLSPGGSGYFTCIQNMKSGGLHEKHVVATWNVGNHLSICL